MDAVIRLKGSGNLDAIHVIKKLGGSLTDSYLDEGEGADVISRAGCLLTRRPLAGFLLDKKIGVNQPKRMENVKILIANTGMDTDKIKVGDSALLHALPRPPAQSRSTSCLPADLWLQGPRGLHRQGGRDRAGGEGEDEGEGGSHPQTRNQLFHQQVHTHTHPCCSQVSSRGRPRLFSASSSSAGS